MEHVPDDPQAIKHFYEGLPTGAQVPWEVWLRPVLIWSALIVAVYFAMICIAVILRRQWIEREKLIIVRRDENAAIINRRRAGHRRFHIAAPDFTARVSVQCSDETKAARHDQASR